MNKELNEISSIQTNLITNFTNEIAKKLDEKYREACLKWGVNIDNHEEAGRRCALISRSGEDVKEFRIDGKLVMLITDIYSQPMIGEKFIAYFRCSEIAEPY